MRCAMIVEAEHLGGPSRIEVTTDLEPNSAAWNHTIFDTMAVALNRALAAMLGERDRLRFEQDQQSLAELHGREPQ